MRTSSRIPSCRLHNTTGQAVVTLNGKDHYLGLHGTAGGHPSYSGNDPCDIDTSGPVWVFRPFKHTNENRDQERLIYIGPKAQEILKPFLSVHHPSEPLTPVHPMRVSFEPEVGNVKRAGTRARAINPFPPEFDHHARDDGEVGGGIWTFEIEDGTYRCSQSILASSGDSRRRAGV